MIDLFTLISIHFLTIYTISKYVFPFVQPLMVRVLAAGKPGTIAFIGATRFAPGQWFGVILDAPDGRNNVEVLGRRYFNCRQRHGLFLRRDRITPIVTNSMMYMLTLVKFCD